MSWLFNFFKNVEPLRPLLFTGIRMPSFPATDEEFSSIIAYFNAISNKESSGKGPSLVEGMTQLGRQIDPVMKYVELNRRPPLSPPIPPRRCPAMTGGSSPPSPTPPTF